MKNVKIISFPYNLRALKFSVWRLKKVYYFFQRIIFTKKVKARNESIHIYRGQRKDPILQENLQDRQKELRIAYVLWDFPALSQTFVINEIKWLVNKDFDVNIYFKIDPDKKTKLDFTIDIYRIEDSDKLAALLLEHKRNIIHSHFAYPAVTLLTYPAAKKTNIPFTFMPHAVDIFCYGNIKRNKLGEIASSPLCLKVFALGLFHKEFFINQGVPEEKIIIQTYGIEIDSFKTDNNSNDRLYHKKFSICTIGRFVEKKGLDYLIRAAELLEDINIVINIYGYGLLEEQYRECIKKKKIKNIKLFGALENKEEVKRVFLENDLFVLPCVRAQNGDMDGLPTVFMEAMAFGLPVLTTSISSITSLVENEITGFLCKSGDAIDLADKIRNFYAFSPEKLRFIINNAKKKVEKLHSVDAIMKTLLSVWERKTFDIFLITNNNLNEIREIIKRIYKYTSMYFNLIIVDNNSKSDIIEYLKWLEMEVGNLKLKLLGENISYGAAANVALKETTSDYIVYLCSKGGLIINHNWERECIFYMDDNPEVGIAGHIVYSPECYDSGAYDKLDIFKYFRNQSYAINNSRNIWGYVQGGFFILKRKVYEEIGGLNENIPQEKIDLEYSYYIESCDWKLGDIPDVYSVPDMRRASIDSLFDENTLVACPLNLKRMHHFEDIKDKKIKKCNICGWSGDRFKEIFGRRAICPVCGSFERTRTLYRYLSESNLIHRNLKCLEIAPHPYMKNIMCKMFDYICIDYGEARCDIVMSLTDLKFANGEFDVILCSHVIEHIKDDVKAYSEIYRTLKNDGIALIQLPYSTDKTIEFAEPERHGHVRENSLHDISNKLYETGFKIDTIGYSSGVFLYDWLYLFKCTKL